MIYTSVMRKRTLRRIGAKPDDFVILLSGDGLTLDLSLSFDSQGEYSKTINYRDQQDMISNKNNDIHNFMNNHKDTVFEIEVNDDDPLRGEEDSFASIAHDAKQEIKMFFSKLKNK